MSDDKLNSFNSMLETVVASLREIIGEELKDDSWDVAILDVRAPAGGGSWVDKLRITLSSGAMKSSSSASGEMASLFMDMWDIKNEAFDKEWYGFRLSIFPNGKSELVFNFDPDCFEDAQFYDW